MHLKHNSVLRSGLDQLGGLFTTARVGILFIWCYLPQSTRARKPNDLVKVLASWIYLDMLNFGLLLYLCHGHCFPTLPLRSSASSVLNQESLSSGIEYPTKDLTWLNLLSPSFTAIWILNALVSMESLRKFNMTSCCASSLWSLSLMTATAFKKCRYWRRTVCLWTNSWREGIPGNSLPPRWRCRLVSIVPVRSTITLPAEDMV